MSKLKQSFSFGRKQEAEKLTQELFSELFDEQQLLCNLAAAHGVDVLVYKTEKGYYRISDNTKEEIKGLFE